MSNKTIFKEIMREYDQDRMRADNLRLSRLEELYRLSPQLRSIDTELNDMAAVMVKRIINGDKDAVEELNRRTGELNDERLAIIGELGFNAEYLDNVYKCNACRDTGFIGNERCNCLKQRLITRYYNMSNLSSVLERENFDTFDMSFYSDEIDPKTGISPRSQAMNFYHIGQEFVTNFDSQFSNLYLYGSTGLGKTFLCNCIAKDLLDAGKTVIYLTAMQLFKLVEDARFNKDEIEADDDRLDMVYSADLLIIDDLGTEFATIVTSAEFFNIINTRLLQQRHTIISSNLGLTELEDHYSDRITSRVIGNYKAVRFAGQDIRLVKKYGGAY